MSKLAMGGMMEAIRNNMQQMVDKKKDAKKLYLYSGHDAGIVTQLGTLQAFDGKAPVYVAAVILELWQNDDTQVGDMSCFCCLPNLFLLTEMG